MAADFGYGNGGLGLRMAVRNSDMPTLKRFCKEASDANDAALLLEPAQTFREWTALHIAAWGALKDPKKAKCVWRASHSHGAHRDAPCMLHFVFGCTSPILSLAASPSPVQSPRCASLFVPACGPLQGRGGVTTADGEEVRCRAGIPRSRCLRQGHCA